MLRASAHAPRMQRSTSRGDLANALWFIFLTCPAPRDCGPRTAQAGEGGRQSCVGGPGASASRPWYPQRTSAMCEGIRCLECRGPQRRPGLWPSNVHPPAFEAPRSRALSARTITLGPRAHHHAGSQMCQGAPSIARAHSRSGAWEAGGERSCYTEPHTYMSLYEFSFSTLVLRP